MNPLTNEIHVLTLKNQTMTPWTKYGSFTKLPYFVQDDTRTNTRNITKLNEREIALGITERSSWHNEYKDSAWIFVGGLSYELTEGDIICVFSQYGEIVNLNLVRDKKTGKSKGYCFICYEDQRSTILAVDNFNGIKLCSRIIRVDHVANYRIPKDGEDVDEETKQLREEGCAPKLITEASSNSKTDLADNVELKKKVIKKEYTDLSYDKQDKRTHKGESKDRHSKSHHTQKVEDRADTTRKKERKKSMHSLKESHKSQSDQDHSHKHRARKNDSNSDDGSGHSQKHRSKRKHLTHRQ